jgi:two-component system sensor kinase FixL
MTERELTEASTRRLAAQLAHAERVWTMGHLASGLAHELNQPLATIANYSEACDVELGSSERDTRTERLRKYVDSTKQAALRAGKIVRRMRNFVQPNATSKVRMELSSLIHEVVELCRIEAEQLGSYIALEFDDERAEVVVDSIQIQQVLVNLVQNALQAMHDSPPGRKRIEIRSINLADDQFVQIAVIDCGPGFCAVEADQMFEPFHTTKSDGLGIGLSICRAIVEDHGGHIWADSTPGGGATVSFTLPLSQSDVARGRIQSECVCSR